MQKELIILENTGIESRYGENVSKLLKQYDTKKINFLEYQGKSFKLISETIKDVEKQNRRKISKKQSETYRYKLVFQWMNEDPLINRLYPPILPGMYTKDAKLKLIGEYLSNYF